MIKKAFFPLILMLILPQVAYADIFPSDGGDISIYYLGELFGHVGHVLLPENDSALMGHLFRKFNMAILSIAGIVLSYGVFASVINTAQEGSFLGQRWSSTTVPFRAIVGLGMMMPSAGGYCGLQVLVLWIVVQGIGLANMLWGIVLDNYEAGHSISLPSPLYNLEEANKTVFKAAVCAAYANEHKKEFNRIGRRESVDIYTHSAKTLHIGVPNGNRKQKHICGRINLTTLPHLSEEENAELLSRQAAAFITVFNSYRAAAQEATESPVDSTQLPDDIEPIIFWTDKGVVSRGKIQLSSFYEELRADYAKPDATRQAVGDVARRSGWIYAASYYRTLVTSSQSVSETVSTVPGVEADNPQSWGVDKMPSEQYEAYNARYQSYLDYSESDIFVPGRGGLVLSDGQSGGIPKPFGALLTPIFNGVTELFYKHLTQNDPDPLLSMANFGQTVMATIENVWFVSLGVTAVVTLGASIFSAFQPATWPIQAVAKAVLPMMSFMMSVLWVGAASLGVYVPLIPYIYFTLGVIAWLMLCIEAVTAGPIIALGFATPSQEEYGKSMHSLMLLFNLFLRPALMIIGFIVGARVLLAVFSLFNYSFAPTMQAQSGTMGFFGAVALIIIYAGISQMLVSECFSTIYILPDRVIRWIGGIAEGTGQSIQQGAQELKQKHEAGDQATAQAAAGAAKAIAKSLGDKDAKQEEDAEAKEDGPGGPGGDTGSADTGGGASGGGASGGGGGGGGGG